MTEHTKGPWVATGDNFVVSYSGNGKAVANCYEDTPDHREGECAANARLIAAAPDLLAALKELHQAVGEAAIDNEPNEWVLAAHRAAFTAIAKAEGR
jgi:hypothetical protein